MMEDEMIKKEDWGFTNPILSNLYGKPPLVWRDADVHLVVYETDIENIEKVIPEPLKANSNKVFCWQSQFELGTTQGFFKETALYVQVEYKGMKGEYEPFLYVGSHIPLTGGREIWGYQKKMAQIEIYSDMEAVVARTSRLGHEIIKAVVVPTYEAELEEIPWNPDGLFSVKYIPSAEENGEPLRELVLTEYKATVVDKKFFGGRASIKFEYSAIDPTYLLEPTKIIGGFYGKLDVRLAMGKIVYNYK
jgi:acetoacetate decarboxylase